jgi:hypothetical protein
LALAAVMVLLEKPKKVEPLGPPIQYVDDGQRYEPAYPSIVRAGTRP